MQQSAGQGIVSRLWQRHRALAGRLGSVLALYAIYLPLSGYQPADLRFDAGQYWELGLKFFQQGHFSLLNYDEPVRGYLGPLLLQPGRLLCHLLHWPGLFGARVLGAGWAALLFGLALPETWKLLTGRNLPAGRWLLLLGLTFIFWRDYFNFPLSDVPALTLLLLGLLALKRPSLSWAFIAGLCLAGAINIRPIYLAATPGVLALLWWRRPTAAQLGALLLGLALMLLPQFLINQRHFQQSTPLVLATPGPSNRPLYLQQLIWGTSVQRFETSLIPAYPRSLIFADSTGRQALAVALGNPINSYGQFLQFASQQPLVFAGRSLRHLFNGLDIWFPTPYPHHLHPSGQAVLRLLNYLLLGLGAGLLLVKVRRIIHQRQRPGPAAALLLAVLLPALLTVPTAIECRFLLPLHLLLLLAVVGYTQPRMWWQRNAPARRLGTVLLLLGWVLACWQLSAATARQLLPPGSEVPE